MTSDNTAKLKRDGQGLLETPPVPYVFNEDGSVNWRKMVRKEFLVANKQRTNETDVSNLEDRDLLILLGGIKELAQIRGFAQVQYDVHAATQEYFAATCTIEWLPNYETDNKTVYFSALADAHQDNTYSFASNFLAATAENRAFVRCVRNFLKINIVGQEEMGGGSKQNTFSQSSAKAPLSKTDSNPSTLLEKVMESKGVSFDMVKDRLLNEGFSKAEKFTSTKDIPKTKTFELIARLKKI
tara:strand:- start:3 stop:725 length:723 start_codon:yes stop_codon:yes gene_type:complete